jgi:hypothetical protein
MLNIDFEEFFGLNQAHIRCAFKYGVSEDLKAGFGRSGLEKTYDGHLKYRL